MTDNRASKPDSLHIHIDEQFKLEFDTEKIVTLIKFICRRFGVHSAQINVSVTDDETIRVQNKKFLNHDYPTDVISFDLSESGDSEKFFDFWVNGQMAKRQAQQRGHSPNAELALYITHGLLHNLGFDDNTEKKARDMHETEDAILRENGFGNVYSQQGCYNI